MAQTTDALDGMWLCGFVPRADHYGIYADSELAGYTCVDAGGYVLQFYLMEKFRDDATGVFEDLVNNRFVTASVIQGAFSSTAEPQMLSYCFEAFDSFEVDTLMYQPCSEPAIPTSGNKFSMELVTVKQLDEAVAFAHQHAGGETSWLNDYLLNLITRAELFGYWVDNRLLATGECRGYDEYQLEYADLGVIVSKSHRRQGIATQILQYLKAHAYSKSLLPICSTEKHNIASQKAISRAGFTALHRVVRFTGTAG